MAIKNIKTLTQRETARTDKDAIKSERKKTRSMATLDARLKIIEQYLFSINDQE